MTPPRYIELSDGTEIAYQVHGEGPPLVLFNGVTTTHFFWEPMLRRWSGRQIILWDYPGHGASGPARTPASARVDGLVEIGLRVMDELGVQRAPCVGYSMGSQVALAAGLRAPERFSAVVSLLGPAGRLLDTALWGVGGRAAEVALRRLPAPGLRMLRATLSTVIQLPTTYVGGRLIRLYRGETRPENVRALGRHVGTLDPETLRAMILSAGEMDLHAQLRDLVPPLLIISGEQDVFAPTHTVGRKMHAAAPSSRLVIMSDGTHGSVFGHAGTLVATIERFLAESKSE